MKRRDFIRHSAVTGTLLYGGKAGDIVTLPTAHAAQHTTGGDAVVSLAGSNDPGLKNPAPLDMELTTDQVRDIVWLALDRDTSPRNLRRIVNSRSWVVLKPNLVTCPVQTYDFLADDLEHWWLTTDIRVVYAVAVYLLEKVGPRRVTIAEGPPWYTSGGKRKPEQFVDGWHCEWSGFGGLSYAGIVDDLNSRSTSTTFDIVDLNEDEPVYITDFDPKKSGIGALQDVAPGDPDGTSDKDWTKRRGMYFPRTIIENDVLISIPVLKTHSSAGVTLHIKNFVGAIHSESYGKGNAKTPIHQGSQLGLARGIADLAALIQPDYGVAEGFWATEQQHHGQNGVGLRHNVVVAGGDVVATEAISMMVMGYHPLDSDMLRMCHMKGLGEWHPNRIDIAGPPIKNLARNFIRAADTFTSRGVRKWLVTGPQKSTLDKDAIKALKPREGTAGDMEWTLLDGDKVVDSRKNVSRPYKLNDCVYFGIPGSKGERKGRKFYLATHMYTDRKDLCGQVLVGVRGGTFRLFVNGIEKEYITEVAPYNPTPSPFHNFQKGENTIVIEIEKQNDRDEEITFAASVCDLDGDRLHDIVFDPDNDAV